MSKKEVVLTREQVREELDKLELRQAKGRLVAIATATGALAVIKYGSLVAPKAVATATAGKAFATGSTMFLGSIAVPNYLFILMAMYPFAWAYGEIRTAKRKKKEAQVKNKDATGAFVLEED